MSESKYDVVVAGLGPAGAVALWHLAKKGFKVAGVDVRDFNSLWGKPCGDAIGAHHFPNSGLEPPSSNVVKNVVKGIDIYSPREDVRYRVTGEGYIIDRRKLGQKLVKEAMDQGAEVFLQSPVLSPIIEGGNVSGLIVRNNGRKNVFKASVVIEATGFSRAVKSRLPSYWPVAEGIDPQDTNIAYREIVKYDDYEIEDPEIIRIYIDQELAPGGYWWFFPESRNTANIGLGVQGGKNYPSPMNIFYQKLKTHKLLRHSYQVVTKAGAPVPTRRPANTLVGNGIMVIGDAGYTVNPVHGGGMGYSFYAAYLAALSFENAYNKNSFTDVDLWELNLKYMRSIGAKQAALDIFRRFLQRLSNDEILFGMKRKLIPEIDVYEVSSSGELKINVVEKALIVLRGLQRPGLLAKLKIVADFMKKAKQVYLNYPEDPKGLHKWVRTVQSIFHEFEEKLER